MPRLAFHFLAIAFVALAGALMADTGDNGAADKIAADKSAAEKLAKLAEKKDLKNGKQIIVTPEREAAVMTFVQRNHPELAELLTHLKANHPRGYEQAIRELHRTTERLAGVQERDLVLYDLEAKAWTAQSRVQLLAAKLRMNDNDAVRKELREALGAQADAKLAVLKHQRTQTAERMAKMDAEISKLENNREQVIEKQIETLRSSVAAKPIEKNSGNKPQFTGNPLKDNKPNNRPLNDKPQTDKRPGKTAE